MKIYLLDEMSCYIGSSDVDPYAALPRCVLVPPPEVVQPQVAQWSGSSWMVLSNYPQPAQPSPENVMAQIIAETQQRLDDFARTGGYDDVNSISKYKDISDEEISALPADEQPLVARFRAESRYLAVAAARTWAKLRLLLAEVEAGTRPKPASYADVEADLPPLEWPAASA